ncbi:MAG: hypothetical protein ACXV7J_08635 [Methylomonas sp.]
MKKATFKMTTLMTCAIAALANTPLSIADTFSGTLAASGTAIEPTDVYALTCPPGTASVRAKATSQADQINVQVISPVGQANTVVSLPGNSPQPTAVLAASAGNFLVTVHKSPAPFVVSYNITLDCHNKFGVAFLNNQSLLIQDQ